MRGCSVVHAAVAAADPAAGANASTAAACAGATYDIIEQQAPGLAALIDRRARMPA
jgi:hypothetical protein